MENNTRRARCAAGLIRACQIIFQLQEIRLFICSPGISPQCPQGFICPAPWRNGALLLSSHSGVPSKEQNCTEVPPEKD